MKKYKIGYTTGVFDMFHIGHLNIIRRAKEMCEYLIVGVTTDALCIERKNRKPIICESERMEIVESIRYVDKVIAQRDMNKILVVQEYKVDAVFVGTDWEGTPAWKEYERQFGMLGCEVVYIDHTDGISSTELRKKVESR